MSLMKLHLSIETSQGPMQMLMVPTTTHDTKKAPPKMLLRPMTLVPVPMKETMLEKTSGAPLPKERSVTPAMVGGSFRSLDKLSKFEQK